MADPAEQADALSMTRVWCLQTVNGFASPGHRLDRVNFRADIRHFTAIVGSSMVEVKRENS